MRSFWTTRWTPIQCQANLFETKEERQMEGQGKMKAETGRMQTQAKRYVESPEAGRGQRDLPEPPEGAEL